MLGLNGSVCAWVLELGKNTQFVVEPSLVLQLDSEFLERSFDHSHSYFCLWITLNWAGSDALWGIFSGWLPEGETFQTGRVTIQNGHNRFPGLSPTLWAPCASCSIQPSSASGSVGSVCHNPIQGSQRCPAFRLTAIPMAEASPAPLLPPACWSWHPFSLCVTPAGTSPCWDHRYRNPHPPMRH